MSRRSSAAVSVLLWVAQLVRQLEIDGNNDFGFDGLAIKGGRRVTPEGNGVYGDLRERGIAAETGDAARDAVDADHRADLHRPMEMTRARFERIAWREAFDKRGRLITGERRVRARS